MQFLMNTTSEELIDLSTIYRCIAFCINLLLQSCFGNLTQVNDVSSVMFDVAQGHLCFHVLMFLLSIKRHLAGGRSCRYDFPFKG